MHPTFIIIVILNLMFCTAVSNQKQEQPDFKLSLAVCEDETSKDSNTDRYNISITGHEAAYSWKHYGYPDEESDTMNYMLNDATYLKLIEYIKTNKLNSNITETQKEGGIGLSVSMNLTITLNGETTTATISGTYNDWSKSEDKKCNIRNIDFYHNVYSIVTSIKNRLEYF